MKFSKIALFSTTLSIATISMPGYAQTVAPPRVPLSDIDCDYIPSSGSVLLPSPCLTAPGATRTVTYSNTTRTPINATTDRVTNVYNVTFDGNLVVDARPVIVGPLPTGTTFTFPIASDARFYFNNGSQTVDLSTNYTGSNVFAVGTALPNPSTAYDGQYFARYSGFNNTVRSISVQQDGSINTSDGGEYNFTLNTPDPTAIVGNNAVALLGTFNGNSGTGALQFGRLSGTATLLSGGLLSNYPEGIGASNTALLSPFALNYAVSTIITTQLDETGLITPTVSVTNGVNMNGSTITNLANGVQPNDAVNVGQLNAVTTLANTAISNAATAQTTADNGLALAGTALANAANAQGTANTALSAATLAQTTADTANATANTALANAATAQGTANTALTNAATAQSTADTALANAATAQTIANTANATANTALTRADTAQASANQALTGVAAASANANTAITTANTAQANAAQALTSANQAVAANAAQDTRIATVENVNIEQSARITAIQSTNTTQDSRLTAVESIAQAQNNKMAALESLVGQTDVRVETNRKEANAGIAAAMAMGGTIMPADANFSMSFNLATYRGQQGFSGAAVAKASKNVYFNAGVAGSTVKGSTGGRVGVTFAW
jgi:hypothetical protein